MTYGNESGAWLKILFFGLAAVGVGALTFGNCEASGTANKHVQEMLGQKGYTDVKITGAENSWGGVLGWACGDEDYHLVEFKATNAAGKSEKGFVCCGKMDPVIGYSKGCTIRN
jgi:hypothetical protein